MIRTIPDTIDLIKEKYKRFVDVPLSWMESIGSKMNDLHGVKDGPTEKKVLDIMSLRKMYVNTANLEKTCRLCEKTFPRNTEYFYAQKHHSQKNHLNYSTYCIACENERTAKYKKKI